MNVLVCGGAGFIGSAFIRNYIKNNPDSIITNLDILTIGSNLENLKDLKNNPNYKFIKDNIKMKSFSSNIDLLYEFNFEKIIIFFNSGKII